MTNLSDDRIDRLAPLFTTIMQDGRIVSLMHPGLATVGSITVTDFDCEFCGNVGRASKRICDHQESMMDAISQYIDELGLPFDRPSEREFRRWQRVVDGLQAVE